MDYVCAFYGLHRGKRFKVQLPENVRKCYLALLNDEKYLRTTIPGKQLAYLLYANASPGLLSISIKVKYDKNVN